MSEQFFKDYQERLIDCMRNVDWEAVSRLAKQISQASKEDKQVFLCGNGGSAANAIHIANDLLLLKFKSSGKGIRATALPANQSVLTCIANDSGYENVFSEQLRNLGRKGDLLIVLSGSGNSQNILNAVETAKEIGMISAGFLGYDGGKCLSSVDIAIHFPVNDMQIAEDLQLVVGHMLMQGFKNGGLDE